MKILDLLLPAIGGFLKFHLGGGGGGGSGQVKYDNLEDLYAEQARAAKFMLDTSMPYIPVAMGNTSTMVNEAMDGTLASRARGQAGSDASAAMGQALTGATQHMERYGATMNPNALGLQATNAALQGAANKSMAMNNASQWAEDQKWNRNAGLFAQSTGMGSGAMQGMSSAGSGMMGIANAQNGMDAANATGYGKFGGALAGSVIKSKDGGYIKPAKLASGGNAWEAYKAANPLKKSKTKSTNSTMDALQMMAFGASPQLLGAGIKDIYKNGWDKSVVGKAVNSLATAGPMTAPEVQPSAEGVTSLDTQFGQDTRPELNYGGLPVNEAGFDSAPVEALPVETVEVGSDLADTAWFKDGGAVKLAMGGMLRMPKLGGMPGVASMDASNVMRVSAKPTPIAKPVMSVAAQPQSGGISPIAVGAQTAKGINIYEKAEAASTAADAAEAAKGTADAADAASKAADAAQAADSAAGGNPVTAGIKSVIDIANGRDAGTAVADAGASYVGAELGAKAGTMIMPGVGTAIGTVLGGLLGGSLFADGGKVNGRKDMRPGGRVAGPGTETSDSIPALLSNGEYVLNAEAVKMVGKKKLDKINDAGLAARGDKPKGEVEMACGGNVKKMAMGGIALGAGVDEYNRQQQMARQNELLQLQKDNAARTAEQFGWQRQQHETALAKEGKLAEHNAVFGAKFKALEAGDLQGFKDADTARKALTQGYLQGKATIDNSFGDVVKYGMDERKMSNEELYRQAQKENWKEDNQLRREQLIQQAKDAAAGRGVQWARLNADLADTKEKKQIEGEIRNLRETYALTARNNPSAAKDVADKLYYEYGVDVDGSRRVDNRGVRIAQGDDGASYVIHGDGTKSRVSDLPDRAAKPEATKADYKDGATYTDGKGNKAKWNAKTGKFEEVK